MQKIEIAYGRGTQTCTIPDSVQCNYGKLKQVEPEQQAEDQVATALAHLVGNIYEDKLRTAKSVAIAISDITRPVPSRVILEQLLPWLAEFGVSEDRITVLVGGGLHRPANSKDLKYILGEHLLSRITKIVAHDADNEDMLTFLGHSRMGTPVFVNKYFAEADYKIVTGMVDAHQFMGFTAGVKGAVIGLGGRPTITGNHAHLFEPGAELGRIEGNPARQDLEDIGRIIGVEMILNVVLNDKKQVINVVAGDPVTAHRKAVEVAKSVFGVKMAMADIVIASPGGFPKDINVYQAQKALTPAMQVVKQGGTIILVAECLEGTGEESFEEEMSLYKTPSGLVDSFKMKDFVIGPHKAYLWSRTLAKARTILVSEQINESLARTLMVEVKPGLQEAMNEVLNDFNGSPKLAILPYANSAIPLIR
ncbi:MAG: nickel-dependent lactate racemase [Desulfitobacteriaceae bacterium]|nr:nickel-dependent lactate racemase [Desulfitobacteriaceae bacterium]MDI6914070.1 nickel-dependent lactate racemase [Desulfitobacteriaceae bacterium]